MKPWAATLLAELAQEGGKAFLSWLRERNAKREASIAEWECIQRDHVERRDLNDPRFKR